MKSEDSMPIARAQTAYAYTHKIPMLSYYVNNTLTISGDKR